MVVMIADGGIETTLDEDLGQTLDEFAAFPLVNTSSGRQALREYYRPYLEMAAKRDIPLVVDTPTWRASSDWGEKLGYDAQSLNQVNKDSVQLLRSLISEFAPRADVLVNGCIGPRFDDYAAEQRMSVAEAMKYHLPQVQALHSAGADRVTSVTTLDVAEGAGVVLAAEYVGIPVAVSFMLEPNGLLAGGSTLTDAIVECDDLTQSSALGYLVNCAHPSEVTDALSSASDATGRVMGVRLNAAREGDSGERDQAEAFADHMKQLADAVPALGIFGGCCGTNLQHIESVAGLVIDD